MTCILYPKENFEPFFAQVPPLLRGTPPMSPSESSSLNI
jgi:hypothetical protein